MACLTFLLSGSCILTVFSMREKVRSIWISWKNFLLWAWFFRICSPTCFLVVRQLFVEYFAFVVPLFFRNDTIFLSLFKMTISDPYRPLRQGTNHFQWPVGRSVHYNLVTGCFGHHRSSWTWMEKNDTKLRARQRWEVSLTGNVGRPLKTRWRWSMERTLPSWEHLFSISLKKGAQRPVPKETQW